jgi:hypothetical protein
MSTADTSSSLRSVDVALNVSSAGWVFCNAFSEGYVVSSVTEVTTGYHYGIAFSADEEVAVTIEGLIPDTNYTVYCYTENFLSNAMPLSQVIETNLTARTACCKEAYFREFVATRLNDSMDIYLYALDAFPSEDTTVDIDVSPTSPCEHTEGSIAPVASAYPARVTFRPQARGRGFIPMQRFIVKGTPGCYDVTLSTVSGSYFQGEVRQLILTSAKNNPSAPVLDSAQFSSNPSQILVTFDTPTDKAADSITLSARGTFLCTQLFDASGGTVNGLAQSQCRWTSSSTLTIILGKGDPVTGDNAEVGESLSLLPNILNPCETCCPVQTQTCPAAVAGSVSIAAPDDPMIPSVSLSTSSRIGSCADITIDPTGSTGAGGRDWRTVSWEMSGDGSQNATAIGVMNDMLNGADTKARVTLPSYLIDSGGSYTITLGLTNFLLEYSTASATVEVTAISKQPAVSIAGPKKVSTTRASALSLRAIGTVPTCPGTVQERHTLSYEWKVYKGSVFQSSMASSSRDPRYFKLPAYSLEANAVYTVFVTASLDDEEASSSITVEVGSAGVVAAITGGGRRSGSTTSLIEFESASYSVDYPDNETAISYSWSCSEISPNYGDDCPVSLVDNTTSVASILADTFTRSVTASYAITLEVENSEGSSATAATEIEMVSMEIPDIVVGATMTKYNPLRKLILTSTVDTIGAAWVTWSSDDFNSTQWQERVLTQVQYQIPTGTSIVELAIASNSLVGGNSYTFVLSATYSSDPSQVDKYEEITILMNEAPYGGSIVSAPTTGTALNTSFLFQTTDWTDDPEDIPLQYIVNTYADSSKKSMVQTKDTVTYVETTVGQGQEENAYQVYVEVEAYDIYGAMDSATTNITVSPMEAAQLVSAADSALEDAFADSDPVAVSTVVNAVSSALNVVDCTVPTSCASLNRADCLDTPKTCGACLSGYLGVDGDANTQCSDPTILRKVGASCTSDANCISTLCSSSGICTELDKECKNDCSNRGDCSFRSVVDDSILASCARSDLNCKAQCENCDTGFYGSDCSLSQSDFDSKRSLRERLCSSIYQTVAIQDISEDVMKSRCTTLSSLLADAAQLSSLAVGNCTAALVNTIELAPEYAGLDSVSELAATTLSTVLGLDLSAELLVNVSNVLESLASSVQDNLAVGEEQKTFTTANARIGTQVVSLDSLTSSSFSAPQTGAEAFNEMPVSNLSVSAGDSSLGAMGVSVVQYTNNPTGTVTDATPMALQTTNYDVAGGRRRRRRRRLQSSTDNTVTFQLQNNQDQNYLSIDASQGTVNCEDRGGQSYSETVECTEIDSATMTAYARQYTITCSGSSNSTVTHTCPSSRSIPTCQIYDGTDFTESSSCSVLRYSADETICSCTVSADANSGSRRLAVEASGSSSLSQYSSSTSSEQLSTYSVSEVDVSDDDSPGATPAPSEGFMEGSDSAGVPMYAIIIGGVIGVCLTVTIGLLCYRRAFAKKPAVTIVENEVGKGFRSSIRASKRILEARTSGKRKPRSKKASKSKDELRDIVQDLDQALDNFDSLFAAP